MAKRIARQALTLPLHGGHNLTDPGALGYEEVDAVLAVHDRPQPLGLFNDVEWPLRQDYAMDVPTGGGVLQPLGEAGAPHPPVVRQSQWPRSAIRCCVP